MFGSWRLDEEFLAIHFGNQSGGIALHKDTPNALAIARLISAAPELLEALEKAIEFHDKFDFDDQDIDFLEMAEAAIAKARGHA